MIQTADRENDERDFHEERGAVRDVEGRLRHEERQPGEDVQRDTDPADGHEVV